MNRFHEEDFNECKKRRTKKGLSCQELNETMKRIHEEDSTECKKRRTEKWVSGIKQLHEKGLKQVDMPVYNNPISSKRRSVQGCNLESQGPSTSSVIFSHTKGSYTKSLNFNNRQYIPRSFSTRSQKMVEKFTKEPVCVLVRLNEKVLDKTLPKDTSPSTASDDREYIPSEESSSGKSITNDSESLQASKDNTLDSEDPHSCQPFTEAKDGHTDEDHLIAAADEQIFALEEMARQIPDESMCVRSPARESEYNITTPTLVHLIQDVHKVDQRNIKVLPSKGRCKQYYCSYCSKLVCNFGRHITTKHVDVKEVSDVLKLPKGHPERHSKIALIRGKSQFMHNSDQNINTGTLIVKRRPNEKKARDYKHYKPCPSCGEMFAKISLKVHFAKCTNNKLKATVQKNVCRESKKVLMNIHQKASNRLMKDVLSSCREDDITAIFAFDELCVLYGNKMCRKYRNNHHTSMIRQRMREMGKFMYELNKIQPQLKSLRDMLDPKYYDDIVNVINHIAGLDERTGKYRAPSTAYNLGLHIKSIALLLEAECIKEQNTEKREAVKDLLCLINEGFTTDINKTVGENQCETKRLKKIVLPTAEDILALKTFLTRGLEEAYNSLMKQYTPKCWRDLAGLTLTSLQLFNRRRAGELERIEISDYKTFEYVNENDDSLQQLDASVKAVARNYGRFFIRGKLNRAVPVILSRQLVSYTDMIVKYREAYGVPRENPYVFGIPGRTHFTHLSACVLIRRYAKACGAPNPHTLRGTELRKQIATACSLYNLSDPLIEDMANHLGHHIDIHKKIYRQSIGREVPNIVNILLKTLGEGEVEEDMEEDSRAFVGNQIDRDSSPVLLDDTHDYDTFGENSKPIHTANETNMTISTPSNRLNLSSIDTVNEKNVTVSTPSNVASHFGDNSQPIHTINKKNATVSTPSNDASYESINTSTSKRTSWSNEEKQAVNEQFDHMIRFGVVPTYKECMDLKEQYPCLEKRTPPQIKSYVVYQTKKKENVGNCGQLKRVRWTTPERNLVFSEFRSYLEQKNLPSLTTCSEVISKHPILSSRTPEVLKAYINNQNKKNKN